MIFFTDRGRKRYTAFLVILTLTCLALSVTLPVCAASAPAGLKVNARAAMVVNMTTGQVLFMQAPDLPMQPASLTKIMSLYLAYEALHAGRIHMSDRLPVSVKAWRTRGSRMFLEPNTQVSLEEIIRGMSIMSANDAAVVLAEYLGGDVERFVSLMNAKARQLGMTESRFENPHGLPHQGQYTTARDMMKLTLSYLQHFPEALAIHSQRYGSYHGIVQKNRNRLLGTCPGVDGLKTGYVAKAGYHLIVTAKRGGTRLVAVVMGAPSPAVRTRECIRLLEEGFRLAVAGGPATYGRGAGL